MTRYTVTPRPEARDVLLTCDDRPTFVLSMRSAPLDMPALTAEAHRIAALLDGRAEAVIEAARELVAYELRADRIPGGGVVRRIRLAAAIQDLDGGDDHG